MQICVGVRRSRLERECVAEWFQMIITANRLPLFGAVPTSMFEWHALIISTQSLKALLILEKRLSR